jgi:hypothetical protein
MTNRHRSSQTGGFDGSLQAIGQGLCETPTNDASSLECDVFIRLF